MYIATFTIPRLQGHIRPNEIIIFEGSQFRLQMLSGSLRLPPSCQVRLVTARQERGGEEEEEAPTRVAMLLAMPRVDRCSLHSRNLGNPCLPSREEALAHAWNPADCSFNLSLQPGDPFTVRRRPVAQSTDCVRGTTGYTR